MKALVLLFALTAATGLIAAEDEAKGTPPEAAAADKEYFPESLIDSILKAPPSAVKRLTREEVIASNYPAAGQIWQFDWANDAHGESESEYAVVLLIGRSNGRLRILEIICIG